MLERHQLLIPLLVALELEVEIGKVASKEVDQLGNKLGRLAAELEDMETMVTVHCKEPHWVTDEVSKQRRI